MRMYSFGHEILDKAAAAWPRAEAVRDAHGSWTYAELAAASQESARWLAGQGIRPGERVVCQGVADRRFVALLYGCARAGIVFVPVNATTRPYQLTGIVADSGAAAVVSDESQREVAGVRCWTLDAISAGSSADVAGPADPEAPMMFFYTSGSTARPKAVVCPHARVVFAARAIADRLGYRPSDVVYCRLPLGFDYGLYQVLLCAIGGATLVLADDSVTAQLMSDIRRHGATVVPVVPALADMMVRLAARDRRPSDIRLFTNTGDTMSPALIARLRTHFPRAGVQLMFGLTECKRVSILDVDGDVAKPGSVGPPLPGTDVAIVDYLGRPVPPGEAGEIVVTGPHVMAGYWHAPGLTARRFREFDGRPSLFTGDIGHVDGDGHLYFHGRRDHVFKLRGMRTSVAEIEAATLDIPGVVAAAVVPPADGRDAFVCVVTELAVERVRAGLRDRLDPSKVPDVRIVPSLPLGATGKVDRAGLARLGGA